MVEFYNKLESSIRQNDRISICKIIFNINIKRYLCIVFIILFMGFSLKLIAIQADSIKDILIKIKVVIL